LTFDTATQMNHYAVVYKKHHRCLVTIQPRSLRDTRKHKEREMRKIITVKNGGFYFILKQAHNALDNIKNNNEFLCEPSRLGVFVAKGNLAE
jgi:hypothetical protein